MSGGGGGGGEGKSGGGGGGGDCRGVPPHEDVHLASFWHKVSQVAAQTTFIGLARSKPAGGTHPVVPLKSATSPLRSDWNCAAVLAQALVTS